MTATTRIVRDRAFLPLLSDIPEGITISQYRSSRSRVTGPLAPEPGGGPLAPGPGNGPRQPGRVGGAILR
jgi:hypothetical protein